MGTRRRPLMRWLMPATKASDWDKVRYCGFPDPEFFVPGRCRCSEDMAESGLAEVRGIEYAGRGVYATC